MDKKEMAMQIARDYFKSSYSTTKYLSEKSELEREETFVAHYLLVMKLAEQEINKLGCIPSIEEQIIYLSKKLK